MGDPFIRDSPALGKGEDAMKRIMLILVVIMLAGTGVAWGGYKLVMSKDKELCTSVLKLFNEDMKEYRAINYEKHEIFQKVPWERVEIDEDRGSLVPYCSVVLRAKFDINNDGQDEYVIKWSACVRGFAFDNLYIYPLDTKWVGRPTWPNLSLLRDTPDKFENGTNVHELSELDPAKNDGRTAAVGGTILQPLIWGTTAYVVLTDLFHRRWIVIAKYLKGSEFKDVCYFRDRSQSD